MTVRNLDFDLSQGFKNTKYSPKKDETVKVKFTGYDADTAFAYTEVGKNLVVTVTDTFVNRYDSVETITASEKAIITDPVYSYKEGKKTIYTTSATHWVDYAKAKGDFYSKSDTDVITKAAYNKLSDEQKAGYTPVTSQVYKFTSGGKTYYTLLEGYNDANTEVTDTKVLANLYEQDTYAATWSGSEWIDYADVEVTTGWYKEDGEDILYSATELEGYTAVTADSPIYSYTDGETTYSLTPNHFNLLSTTYVTKAGDGKPSYSDFTVTNEGSINEVTKKTNGNTAKYDVTEQTKDYKLTLTNAVAGKADDITVQLKEESPFSLYTYSSYNLGSGKSVKGSWLNETAASTKANQTFTLGTGADVVNFTLGTGETTIGNDTVKLTAGENINLNFAEDLTLDYERKGSDVIVKATKGTADAGQVTLKNYAKIGTGSVRINNDDTATAAFLAAVNAEKEATHKGNKYTGTVFNDFANSTKANETFALSTGEDVVTFKDVAGETNNIIEFGKDTVALASGEYVTLDFGNIVAASDYFTVDKSGNNAVVYAYRKAEAEPEEGTFYSYVGASGTVYTKDATRPVANEVVKASAAADEYYQDGTTVITADAYGELTAEQKEAYTAVAEGTAIYQNGEALTLAATHAVDNTLVAEGTNIYAKVVGEDTVYTTEVQYTDENPKLLGQVTLQNYFKLQEPGQVTVTYNNGSVQYDDLDDMFESAWATKYVAPSDAKKGVSFTGTFLDEEFYGSKFADKISTGGGYDLVNAGKGNDTITLAKENVANISIAGGDGNDTIKLAADSLANIDFADDIVADSLVYAKSGNNLVISHDTYKWTEGSSSAGVDHYSAAATHDVDNTAVTSRTENDFYAKGDVVITAAAYTALTDKTGYAAVSTETTVYSYGTGDDATYYLTAKHAVDNELVTEKTTVANYFKVDGAVSVEGDLLNFESATSGDYLTVAVSDKDKKVTGSAYNDYIVAGKKTTVVNAGEGNNLVVQNADGQVVTFNAGKGNDTYNVTDLTHNVDINDKGGDDTLNMYGAGAKFGTGKAEGTLTAVFDVMATGKTAGRKDDMTTLHIVQQGDADGKFTFAANIHDYFKKDSEGKYVLSDGVIETVKATNTTPAEPTTTTFDFGQENFDYIRGQVSAWLTAEGRTYSSAYEVLQSDKAADIQALLALYQTGAAS